MNPFETLHEIERRGAEAIIAQSGINHRGLMAELRRRLQADAADGGLLQEPVIEGVHPFEEADETIGALAPRLLHPRLVDILDATADYPLRRSWRPYRHQHEAWSRLGETEPQSVLVTSGTGSGKTECFLIPILNDLIGQMEAGGGTLEGVQAIMLYPLNALIESQRERLTAWTAPLSGRVRFGLYNGNTPQAAPEHERRRTPHEVIDRAILRSAPPPILVTNPTMLEYMTVRAEDGPILAQSRGKLRWLVLDEAHSLIGAAAAETALLIRRVLLAFDVRSEDVRFVATSATIGSGEDTRHRLATFLADVAGIAAERVHVIEGHRRPPRRPSGAVPALPADLAGADPALLHAALSGRDPVWSLVGQLHAGAVPLTRFAEVAQRLGTDAATLATALAAAQAPAVAERPGEVLAPLRIHGFQRAVPGLWSCVNDGCASRPPDWRFGGIVTERADTCPTCKAPVLEIIACSLCGEPFLEGDQRGGRLATPVRLPPADEFRDEAEREEGGGEAADDDEDDPAVNDDVPARHLFPAGPAVAARPVWLDRRSWRIVDAPGDGVLTLHAHAADPLGPCPACHERPRQMRPLRPVRFGAPFLLGNSAPIILESVRAEPDPGEPLPSGGRRLLSFTDSRQGTARLAAKLEIESERNFVRSLIYHIVQSLMMPAADATARITEIDAVIQALEGSGAGEPGSLLFTTLESQRRERNRLAHGSADGLAWSNLVSRLAERSETQLWIKNVWAGRDPGADRFDDPTRVAQFLLLREFGRRPQRANSIETLGLARLRFPAIDGITTAPAPFLRRNRTAADWRAFLDVVLTHFVRANTALAVEPWLQHWAVPKARFMAVAPPGDGRGRPAGFIPWPDGSVINVRSRPVALLRHGLGLDLADPADRDDLATCLADAWSALAPVLRSPLTANRALAFEQAHVAPVTEAWWCAVTRRVLDRAAFGITPHSIGRAEGLRPAEPITMPRHPAPLAAERDPAAREAVQDWLATDPLIADLRDRGGWSNLGDRIALFAPFARAAEHSAQQDAGTLRHYESEFKAGTINILSCSTTMEMGVDIGSVEAVMMTNVPPSISSYRQRVGRAGRRGQPISLAFTFCKDRPLDREAFRDPLAFLRRQVAAPRVALDSIPIVQRHVNAYLLACFLREQNGQVNRTRIGEFMGCPAALQQPRLPVEERPVDAFAAWLDRIDTRTGLEPAVRTIVRSSVLEHDTTLFDAAALRLRDIRTAFVADWEGLRQLARDETATDPARSAIGFQLRRLCDEFILGAMADRGFLPGHGFPTHVVQFMTNAVGKTTAAGENRLHGRGAGPQRPLDLAIRDYAPGAEIVVDGLVHRSAGVTLNWQRPANAGQVREVQALLTHWLCRRCGSSDVVRSGRPVACPVCAAADLRLTDFLKPGGFAADPREKPHAAVERVDYIAPEKTEVSARSAPWRSLPVPGLGRSRTSREGLVFHASRGASRHGYAICLECGRAAAETGGDGAPLPPAMAGHRPLRGLRQGPVCTGVDRPFAIIRRRALGHEVTTDVFEFQPSAPMSEGAANALAIALREALAGTLGIEADEMGYAVADRLNALGTAVKSLFLHDRAAGGAGFAVLAEPRIRTLVERARTILDCRTPGCQRGCSACVLTSDAPDVADALDRVAALRFVDESLRFPQDIGPADAFTAGAVLSGDILEEIEAAMQARRGAHLSVFVGDGVAPSALAGSRLGLPLARWTDRGYPVTLILPPGTIPALSPADRLALRDFVSRHRGLLDLAEGPRPTFTNGGIALGAVAAPGEQTVCWATRDGAAGEADENWGRAMTSPVAHARLALAIDAQPVAMGALAPLPGAENRAIASELDGHIRDFGARAAALFAELCRAVGRWPDSTVAGIVYQDPFVSSPLVARLLLDSCAALVQLRGGGKPPVRIETRPPDPSDLRSPTWIGHNWTNVDQRGETISRYGARLGLAVTVAPRTSVPHGRYLTITFADDSRVQIILDQGFGAWRLPHHGGRVVHPFAATPEAQAGEMANYQVMLQREGAGSSYVVAVARP